jgi:hypothetical protein
MRQDWNWALFLGVVAFDDAADDVGAETTRGQKTHLARNFGCIGGRLAAGKPTTPYFSCTVEFGAPELGRGVRVQCQTMLGQLGLNAAVAKARRAGMHPGFDEALFAEQPAGLQFVKKGFDLGAGVSAGIVSVRP